MAGAELRKEHLMSTRKYRLKVALALCAVATLFQVGFVPRSCVDFGLRFGLSVFDTCNILNCTQGTFFNLCEPFVTLVDCPNATTTAP